MVSLTPIDDSGTLLEMVESGYTSSDARDLSAQGLEQCLDKLQVVVES